jgi:hypothetical protein
MAAVGTDAKIAESLFQRLAALVLSPPLPVSYPDPPAPFVKPTTGPWLEASFLPAATSAIGISAYDEHVGLLQVTVVYPNGAGVMKPVEIAGAVAAWFPRNLQLANCAIYDTPSIAPLFPDNDNATTRTPVSIRYRAFVK